MSRRNVTFLIGANYDNFKKNLSGAEKRFRSFARNAERVGTNLRNWITLPILGIGAASLKAFGQQEAAEKKLRAALQSNGREVDALFNRYSKFAAEMQRVTVVGDETTLAMLQQAESMGITGKAAERAVKNAIAMQSAFNVSADRAIRYTAALEQGNSTMLNRYIPTLQSITSESERTAKAQEILAGAFEVAKEEAQSKQGQLEQFKNTMGDVGERIGEIVLRAINPYTERIQAATMGLKDMNVENLESKVRIMAVAAALGPAILLTTKLAKATIALTAASKGLIATLIKHPYIAIIAAMTAMGVEAHISAKRVRNLNEAIDEALNSDATLTKTTLEEITQLIVAMEEKIKRTSMMSFRGTTAKAVEAHQRHIAELNEELERLIELRDKIAIKQLDEVIASRDLGEAAEGVERVTSAINRLKPVVEQTRPISEIIDPEEIWEAQRIMNMMSQDINDIVAAWEKADKDGFGELFPTDEESKNFTEYARLGAQLFEQMAFHGERLDRAIARMIQRIATQGVFNILLALATGGISKSGGFLKTFFGGFFADGGTLRPGQWGIVGERGPEAIMATPSGAVITPNISRSPMVSRAPGGMGGHPVIVEVRMDSLLVDRQLTRFREGRP